MTKADVTKFFKNVKLSMVKHSPEILTGIGIAGMVTTTVLAVKATPKAIRLIEDAEYEKGDALKPVEKVKVCWKCYIPAVVTGTVSTACLIGASSVHVKRNAALATAYKLSETALTEYREKVVETIGEKKEQTVRDKVAAEQLKKNPVNEEDVVNTEKGTTLCYDPLSARYFHSDIEIIKRAENAINKRILSDICGSVSLNEFYDELDLPRTDMGYDVGWCVDHMVDLDFSSHVTPKGKPCLVVGHYNAPKYGIY